MNENKPIKIFRYVPIIFLIGAVGGSIFFWLAEHSIEALQLIVSSLGAAGTVSVSYIAVRRERKKPDLDFYLINTRNNGYDVFAVNKGAATVLSVGGYYEEIKDSFQGKIPHYDTSPEPDILVVCREYESTIIYHFDPIISKISIDNDPSLNSKPSTKEEGIQQMIDKSGTCEEEIDVVDKATDNKWTLSVNWKSTTEEGIPYLKIESK
ncbi:hypothetical protein [Lacticaseibacillus paracasei]|uniref:hypothetical protein n=1 Tax=Lacticaseibacillus paracasei TaxID=1597 RepID=UPI001C11CBED|nr:hypothetical protein [Lacticaseibacillus paracasei]MBU5324057.1 hypothetical protein [Lacticaseibacillus paracasei]